MKRLISVSLALILITLAFPSNSFANSPTSIPRPLPPRAENIFILPTIITPGANVTVTFNVIFSRDTVRTTAVVGFRERADPSGVYYSSLTYDSTGTPSNQLLKAQIMIPAWAPIGKYELQIVLPYDADGQSGFVQIKDALFVGTEADKTSAEARSNLLSQQIIFSPIVKSSYKQTLRSLPMKFNATSNLPVFVYNNTNDVCEYEAGSISLKMAGRCVIAISQEGNDKFAPAENVILEFSIIGTQKLTITCTKAKITKKVSGTNPKCPKGYKKAS